MSPQIKKYLIGFFFIFAVKLCVLFIYTYTKADNNSLSFLAYGGGDAYSYVTPIKNLVSEGEYYASKEGIKYYAVRPPHYMLLYYILYKCTGNEKITFDLIVLVQLLFHILSILLLSILAEKITSNKLGFYISIFLLSLTSSMSVFTDMIMPESLCISLISLSMYLFYKYKSTDYARYLFFAALMLTWSVQMRPYLVLALIIPFLFVGFKLNVRLLKHYGIVIVAISCITLPWIYRNYEIYNKIAPYDYKILDYYYGFNFEKSAEFSKRKLVNAWGYGDAFWDIDNAGSFFLEDTSIFKKTSRFKFSSNEISDNISIHDYEKARELYLLSSKDSLYNSLDSSAVSYFDSLVNVYQKEKPINYYVLSPLSITFRMIFHSGTYHLPFKFNDNKLGVINKIWKLSEFVIYKIVLLFSVLGLCVLILRRNIYLVFALIPISVIVTCFILRVGEYRYFAYSYPVLFLFASVSLSKVLSFLMQRFSANGNIV